jgi:hypothetical protein
MENNICVYVHKKPNGQIFYVGIGNEKRPYNKFRKNPYWKNTINKYPNYIIEIIDENLTWGNACVIEKRLIKKYGRKCDGGILCNITLGGDGAYGLKHSQETKEKLKETSSKNKNCVGIKHTENAKLNMSKSHMGKKIPKEVRDKMSKTHSGRQGRESDQINVKKAHIKNTGRVQSNDEKEKRAKKLCKPIEVNGVTYESIKKYSELMNIDRAKVWRNLKNEKNKNYKYINK